VHCHDHAVRGILLVAGDGEMPDQSHDDHRSSLQHPSVDTISSGNEIVNGSWRSHDSICADGGDCTRECGICDEIPLLFCGGRRMLHCLESLENGIGNEICRSDEICSMMQMHLTRRASLWVAEMEPVRGEMQMHEWCGSYCVQDLEQ
jgi:hypothetical protein